MLSDRQVACFIVLLVKSSCRDTLSVEASSLDSLLIFEYVADDVAEIESFIPGSHVVDSLT